MRRNHRATVQCRKDGDDWTSEQTTWEDVASVFVGLRPMSGRELAFAQQVTPTASYKVEASWHSSFTPGNRLKLSTGRIFEINHVANLDERSRTALLTCTEAA